MPQLISNNAIVDNNWQQLARDEELPSLASDQQYLVHIAQWLENKSTLASNANIGIWLDSDDDAELLADHLNDTAVIAINFPVFADGRGYSLARRLKDKLGYSGDLRAIGDVLKDQIFFYQRCGFTSFALREDRPADTALRSTEDFSAVYQSAADGRTPVLRKR